MQYFYLKKSKTQQCSYKVPSVLALQWKKKFNDVAKLIYPSTYQLLHPLPPLPLLPWPWPLPPLPLHLPLLLLLSSLTLLRYMSTFLILGIVGAGCQSI